MSLSTFPCPCESGKSYQSCCQPYHLGKMTAPTPEALMRSRYSAYVQTQTKYLLHTWHHSTQPADIAPDTIANWCKLEILATSDASGKDTGFVEFRATAFSEGKMIQMHEKSTFVCENGQWYYVSGEVCVPTASNAPEPTKIGRNSPCPCGSGKKFKRCCATK